jgi:hypothetical protein
MELVLNAERTLLAQFTSSFLILYLRRWHCSLIYDKCYNQEHSFINDVGMFIYCRLKARIGVRVLEEHDEQRLEFLCCSNCRSFSARFFFLLFSLQKGKRDHDLHVRAIPRTDRGPRETRFESLPKRSELNTSLQRLSLNLTKLNLTNISWVYSTITP